jgi:hypothetical protein
MKATLIAGALLLSLAGSAAAQSKFDPKSIKLLPSGWKFSGGSFETTRLPNGDKTFGAVQHCGDAGVFIVLGEGKNNFSQWTRFRLTRWDSKGRGTEVELARYQKDGQVIASKPELSISGNSVEGVTVLENGKRETVKKSVNNCMIQ